MTGFQLCVLCEDKKLGEPLCERCDANFHALQGVLRSSHGVTQDCALFVEFIETRGLWKDFAAFLIDKIPQDSPEK